MELIKNGNIVLNGTRTRKDIETLLLKSLEIIVDKNVDIGWLVRCKSVKAYNYATREQDHLTEEQFNLVKEITK